MQKMHGVMRWCWWGGQGRGGCLCASHFKTSLGNCLPTEQAEIGAARGRHGAHRSLQNCWGGKCLLSKGSGQELRKGTFPRTPRHDGIEQDTTLGLYTSGPQSLRPRSIILKSFTEIPETDCFRDQLHLTFWWGGWRGG